MVRQFYFTPVCMAAAALALDDLIVIRNIKKEEVGVERVRKKAMPMSPEGDAKSKKDMIYYDGPLLALAIALTVLGCTLHLHHSKKDLMRDAGIVAATAALGSIVIQCTHELSEKLDTKNSHPRVATLLTVIKTFQLLWPMGVGISVVPDNPVSYGITGFLYGAGRKLSQLFFQYRVPDKAVETSFVDRIKALWQTKKIDLALNGLYYALLAAWTTAILIDGGGNRDRGAMAAFFGSAIASLAASGFVGLNWNPSNSAVKNSLFFNMIALSPIPLLYLLGETKFNPDDVSLSTAPLLNTHFQWLLLQL